jgi:small subunit ribosomal protein S17
MKHNSKARILSGKVISSKMEKTFTISIERLVKHSLYGKYIKKTTKLHVHDEDNLAQEGDVVSIQETRPYSKTKSWILLKVDRSTSVQLNDKD